MDPSAPRPDSGLPGVIKAILIVAVAAAVGLGVKILVERSEKQKETQRQAEKELDTTTKAIHEELRKEAERDGSVSAETAMRALDKAKDAAAKAGEAGQIEAKAFAEFLAETQKARAPYMALLKRVEESNPWDVGSVKQKSDLESRRQFAREMLQRNQEMTELVISAESRLRAKFKALGATGPAAQKTMNEAVLSIKDTMPIQIRGRKAAEDSAKALLEICDLLESDWGKWKIEGGAPVFDSDATLAKYNALIARADKATEDEASAQREALNVSKRK